MVDGQREPCSSADSTSSLQGTDRQAAAPREEVDDGDVARCLEERDFSSPQEGMIGIVEVCGARAGNGIGGRLGLAMEIRPGHGEELRTRGGGAARERSPWPDVSGTRRRIMRANRRRDTSPEKAIRSLLHRMGLRFRVDYPVRVPGARAIRPDIVFPKQRVAVFVDGCFWHGCPEHGTTPRTNAEYWVPKIRENQARDRRNAASLEAAGWTALRLWTHDTPEQAADRIARIVRGHAA
jgi:DNA mismatch endonuclease, patch repair protein